MKRTIDDFDPWAWVALLLLVVLVSHGDPDLLDVLEAWCRQYIEARRG
ncbi:hypothetical protein [Luteimonas saliphila]|nr:hypothetical protein [Luteimonas saliphila]